MDTFLQVSIILRQKENDRKRQNVKGWKIVLGYFSLKGLSALFFVWDRLHT